MLWSAFLLGIFGGLHCIGMCGPIALALPKNESITRGILKKSIYNGGRILTYTLFGVLGGTVGLGISIAGWQQGLSIAAGLTLIAVVAFSGFRKLDFTNLGPLIRFSTFLRSAFSSFITRKSMGSMLVIGILNGFLPCGLVYIALAGAIAEGSIEGGAAYMAIFGLGTFPVMFAISFGGSWIGISFQRKLYRIVPALILALGLLFILRGLNLGIPYISPKLTGHDSAVMMHY